MTDGERSPFARPLDDAADVGVPDLSPAPNPARAAVEDEPGERRRRWHRGAGSPAPWVIVAIVLAVLGTLAAFAVRAMNDRPTAAPSGPGEVAQRYLQAIAAADPAGAQALAAIKIDSPTFAKEPLAASMKAAPLTDITVEGVNGQDVVLAYRLGGKPVRGTFPMVHVAEGWRVKRPTVQTRIAPSPQMIVSFLDGQKLEGRSYTFDVELAPGQHDLSLDEGFLVFEQPRIMVTGLTDQPQVNARTRTTPTYPAELRKRLEGRLKECLARRELAPAGCPWAFKAAKGDTVDPATIRYTMASDPFQAFAAPAVGTADAIVRGQLRFEVKVDAKAKRASGGTSTISDDRLVTTGYEADLADPDLPFIWTD